ncbi:MAG: U32 family peptidase [Clostridia bacterium]|nr:U32 family peptidase [Clostridia bacterium]
MSKTPELLAPAGNFEKLRAALLYGADAVYLAGSAFGMRAAADNFSVEELHEASVYTHARGKKLYLTVNTMPRVFEYGALERYFDEIKDANLDALIIADPGVFTLAKKMLPHTELHVSTQAGAVSHADCSFWYEMGASRVVLARELSMEEITAIRAKIPANLELECFMHGSMCVSWSGRCLLSNHFIGRDANRGMCAQPCRWDYHLYEIAEDKRPNVRFPVEENDLGTFIMSSRDMCMIEHIPELMDSGIASFKIEGRMKSAYYTAVTANAYRMAMDAYLADPTGYTYNPAWMTELESVSHREYCTGFYFGETTADANLCTLPGYIREKAYLATVEAYDPASGIATLKQRNKLTLGDTVEIITPGKVGRAFKPEALFLPDGSAIESTPHPYMEFRMPIPFEAHEGDIIRLS